MTLSEKAFYILFSILVLFGISSSGQSNYSVQMKRAIDGDTFIVNSIYEPEFEKPKRFSEGSRVRLYGVDAPELGQPFGKEAKELATANEGSTVVMIPKNEDGYGRTVALIHLENGEFLQERLLRLGAAWVYPQFCTIPKCNSWKELEKEARHNRRGLWAGDNPIEPWRWRKEKRP